MMQRVEKDWKERRECRGEGGKNRSRMRGTRKSRKEGEKRGEG